MSFEEVFLNFHKKRDFKFAIAYFEKNRGEIKLLVDFITSKKAYPYAEYASWLLVHLTQFDESLVEEFHKDFIDTVLKEESNQTVLRNCVNILVQFDLIEYKEGELIDRLISFVQNGDNKVALQVYSIQMFVKYLFKYPELKEEFTSIVELYREGRSAAYQSAVRTYHKKVKKIK